MDRGAWWITCYRVAMSRTWLKRCGSSNLVNQAAEVGGVGNVHTAQRCAVEEAFPLFRGTQFTGLGSLHSWQMLPIKDNFAPSGLILFLLGLLWYLKVLSRVTSPLVQEVSFFPGTRIWDSNQGCFPTPRLWGFSLQLRGLAQRSPRGAAACGRVYSSQQARSRGIFPVDSAIPRWPDLAQLTLGDAAFPPEHTPPTPGPPTGPPSPMDAPCVLVTQQCPSLCDPMDGARPRDWTHTSCHICLLH